MAGLIGLFELQELLGGVSRQRAAEIAARATFPQPLAALRAGRIWDREQVIAWIREHRPTQREDLR